MRRYSRCKEKCAKVNVMKNTRQNNATICDEEMRAKRMPLYVIRNARQNMPQYVMKNARRQKIETRAKIVLQYKMKMRAKECHYMQ